MNNILAFPNKTQDAMLLLVRFVSPCLVFIFEPLGNPSPSSFSFLNIVRSIGFREHCYVWKKYFLVLGNFSCSILWCNMGTVSYLIDTLSVFMHVIRCIISYLYGSVNYNNIFFIHAIAVYI
jgi:hypothetical protein